MVSLHIKVSAMTFALHRLQSYLPIQELTASQAIAWVGFSGGLDSCVLLHALVSLKLPISLRAIHINHQISSHADQWQQHCADVCAQLGVSFVAVKVDVKNTGKGIEDAAREVRYRVFEAHLMAGDYLFTAHHADDQAETLLLRLMRGSGVRGLAAMAQQRPLGMGMLHRPLLHFSRQELAAYAQEQGLVWVDDESNSNDHYDRNYLRNQVLPLLRQRWPAFTAKWQQTADLCAANEALVDELANADLQLAQIATEFIGTSVSLGYIEALSDIRRHNLIRVWLRRQGLATPEQAHLQQIEQQIIDGRQDAEAQVSWGDVSLRVYRQRLYALPLAHLPQSSTAVIPFADHVHLSPTISLVCECLAHSSQPLLKANLPNLHIRFRQGGERCKPVGRGHSQTLKRLLQEYHVVPWLRDALPLIYSDDELVAVADLWVCEGYQTENDGFSIKYSSLAKTNTAFH